MASLNFTALGLSLFSCNWKEGQRKLKHFRTVCEIKSYQEHLQKNKPQEMATQMHVTNQLHNLLMLSLVWQKKDLLSQSLEWYMRTV